MTLPLDCSCKNIKPHGPDATIRSDSAAHPPQARQTDRGKRPPRNLSNGYPKPACAGGHFGGTGVYVDLDFSESALHTPTSTLEGLEFATVFLSASQ